MKAVVPILIIGIIGAFFVGRSTAPIREVRIFPEADEESKQQTLINIVEAEKEENIDTPELVKVAAPVVDTPNQNERSVVSQLRNALDLATQNERKKAYTAALAEMRAIDGPAGHQLFLDFDTEGRHFFPQWMEFWTRWGELDPEGAYEYITSGKLGTPQMRTSTSASTPFIGYKGKDPAQNFLAKLDLSNPQDFAAASGVIGGLAEVDLDAATQIAIANSNKFTGLASMLAEAAVQEGGLENLMTWYDDLPVNSQLRAAALRPTKTRIARADSEVANAWAEGLTNP